MSEWLSKVSEMWEGRMRHNTSTDSRNKSGVVLIVFYNGGMESIEGPQKNKIFSKKLEF